MEKSLPLYVAGDLAGRRPERQVTNHLATCARCRGLAEEYDASRHLLAHAATTLPPEFDGAFYEEIRSSVLAEIKRGRTPFAPPAPFAGFASLFPARFAYAASLALLFATIAALSLHSYVGRKSEDAAQQQPDMLAGANRARTAATAATPVSRVTTASDNGQSSAPFEKNVAETTRGSLRRAAKPPALQRHANNRNAQPEPPRSVDAAKHAPSHAARNPPTLNAVAAATTTNNERVEGIARNGVGGSGNGSGAASVAPEVSRIEMQTSDPNIRIIWLSPAPDDAVAQPLK